MSKRSAAENESLEGQAFSKARPTVKHGLTAAKRNPEIVENSEMGEFEDEFEDDIESDGEVIDGAADEMDGMDVDDEVQPAAEDEEEAEEEDAVYLPGSHTLAADEVLQPDQTVYEMLHHMDVAWPCLSFDLLRDSLGDNRQKYPATVYLATGTQADVASKNELLVMKMSKLHKTQKDDENSDDDDSDDEDDVDEDAILEYRSIPHMGGVNRVRAQQLALGSGSPPSSDPYYTATWAETGKVHIWNVRPLIESLDQPGYTYDRSIVNKPVFSVSAHRKAEGFALDWSPSINGSTPKLLSGDIHSKIYLTSASDGGFETSPQAFESHTSSVEDLQWSPSEQTVFASCSADQSIRIWDVRVQGRKNVVGVTNAHDSDVNVISWNKGTSYLLASGGDEGGIKIWDLRNFKKSGQPSPVASFSWHKAPVTSIEWHPTEDSVFVASGADEQVTLWDLSVEQDDDETGAAREMLTPQGERLNAVPPQLLFVHQGQKDVKEVHWHPQISGAVVSTAADGFNVFKTISV